MTEDKVIALFCDHDLTAWTFLQRDPDPGKLSVPASVVNGYAYAANNPGNITDPTGASWLGDAIKGLFNFMLDVSAWAIGGIGALAADLAGYTDIKRAITFSIIFGIATGGAGAAAGAAVGGGILGAAVGAGAGGLVGGLLNTASGRGNFWTGFLAGALAGGIAGFRAGPSGVKPSGVDETSNALKNFSLSGGQNVALEPVEWLCIALISAYAIYTIGPIVTHQLNIEQWFGPQSSTDPLKSKSNACPKYTPLNVATLEVPNVGRLLSVAFA